MVPRQPVEQRERLLAHERPDLRELLLIGRQHAVSVDHAFGQPGGAGGEQELGNGLRADRCHRLLQCRPGTALRHVVEGGDLVEIGAIAGGDDLAATQVERRQRLGESGGVADIDETRLDQFGDMLELAVILALQRIGNRDRRHRHAGGMAGKREQRMIDAVARQDHDRPRGRQAALDEAVGKRVHDRSCRFVAELAPLAVGSPLGQKQSAGIARDRRAEHVGQAWIVRRQWLGRAAAQAAVRHLFADDPGRAIGDRAQRNRFGHFLFLADFRPGMSLRGGLMHDNPQWQDRMRKTAARR